MSDNNDTLALAVQLEQLLQRISALEARMLALEARSATVLGTLEPPAEPAPDASFSVAPADPTTPR